MMSEYTYNSNKYKINDLHKKQLKVLIIDDDIEITTSLKLYLELRGHIVSSVDEGTNGLSKIYNNHFDVIFLDYHLQNDMTLDGAVIGKYIKEDINQNENCIVFAYTGDSSINAIQNFKDSGLDGVIYKPVDITVLDKVMNVLENNNKILLSSLNIKVKKALVVF